MSSVQFRNVPDVLNAFKATGIVNWSIWQGKQYLTFKYTGKDEAESEQLLESACMVLRQSAAIYTLKLYEGLRYNSNGHCTITKSTEDSGCFNFRFMEETYGNPSVMANREMESKIAALTLQLEQMKAEKEADSDDDEGIMGALNNTLKDTLPIILPGLIGKFFGGGGATALAGIPEDAEAVFATPPGIQADPVLLAIQHMRAADPGIDKHLIKLGEIARENPKKFKGLVSMMKML